MAYPISLSITALLIFITLIIYKPSKKLIKNKIAYKKTASSLFTLAV